MSQIDSDFASIKKSATQYSDAWFNAVIIESLTHGMYTAVLAIALLRILSSTTIYRWQVKIVAGISGFMYIMATLHIAVRWFYIRRAFIAYGETEETRYHALMGWLTTGSPIWALMINIIAGNINALISECVTIWRCWIIWERNWRIVALPCICTLCATVFGLLSILQQLVPLNYLQISISKGDSIDWSMAFYIMGLPTTAMCTTLIVYRLAKASNTRNSPCFTPNPYYHVIEMLVESSGLYLVVLVVFIVFEATKSPYSRYPAAILESVIGIAPALILLRVVSRDPDLYPSSDNMDSWHLQRLPRSKMEDGETRVDNDEVIIIGPEKTVQVV
ncbi:uncharacterized protein EV420DRAFT_1650808 [Desarmillaria tabescens]|uniref:Uncharacterized protein n=1 Tax=Armillaria tabescens TaxID=1929756 RepID=A0AA39JBR0_ARMTA|nr:uncharacterized protein EV420DRAFT_1650808 [Desarmillaria tabescens]KAK0439688.1 hypothetical protein EV420DRAFT_1650808 [Desarmillaria tabescens]